MQTDPLDDLLAFAAKHPPSASPELMERVVADALAQQPQPRSRPQTRAGAVPRPGLMARLTARLGGAAALAGVTSAALCGVALGYLDPTTLDLLALGQATEQTEAVDLFPSVDFLMTEG